MCRYAFYLAVTIFAFITGSLVVMVSYLKTDINVDAVEDPTIRYTKAINNLINRIESENRGFEDLSNAKDGDLIMIQGYIDEKFLCPDVTESQTDVCTTTLLDHSSRDSKMVLIRIPICNAQNKSNCVAEKPDKQCSFQKLCYENIRIYDSNSKPTDLVEEIRHSLGGIGYSHKNIQLKATGRVSVIENKPRLLTPIEKLEIIEIR